MRKRIKAKVTAHLSTKGLKGFTPPVGVEIVWDEEIAGFGLRTKGSADPETWRWVFRYRHRATGTQPTLTLGAARTHSPEDARRWAKTMAKRVNTSDDPTKEKTAERMAAAAERAKPTMTQLWNEWRDAEGKAKRSARDDASRWRTHVEPWFGKMKVADVTPAEVNKFKASMSKRPVVANRCIALLSKMMTFAIVHRYRGGCDPQHPIKHGAVKRYAEQPVDFYFTPEQLGRLLEAADAEANKAGGLAIRMLALTGARASEVTRAHWRQITEEDDGRLTWIVERSNTKTGKPYTRTLDPDLSRRLNEWRPTSLALQKVVKPGAPLWVFPQTGHAGRSSTSKPMVRIFHVWERVKKAAGVKEGRIHDLRHTAATAIVKATGSLEPARRQLGHATVVTTQRYAHHIPEMAQKTSDLLAREAEAAMQKAREMRDKAEVVKFTG